MGGMWCCGFHWQVLVSNDGLNATAEKMSWRIWAKWIFLFENDQNLNDGLQKPNDNQILKKDTVVKHHRLWLFNTKKLQQKDSLNKVLSRQLK